MKRLIEFVSGYKTYILVAVGILVYGAEGVGLLESGTADKIAAVVGMLGLGTLRAGVSKLGK